MTCDYVHNCRICGSKEIGLKSVLDLGDQPLANNFASNEVYPLVLMFCDKCQHGQLSRKVDRNILFAGSYPFLAGQSQSWVEHCKYLVERFVRPGGIIDIGANDGTLLGEFRKRGMVGVGIEPSDVSGDYVKYRRFWDQATAEDVVKIHWPADIITATNVFAHVDNFVTFLDAVSIALAPNGLFIFEVPDLAELLRQCEYDTIYHEHLNYFSFQSIYTLIAGRKDLFLNSVEKVDIHGGSLLVTVFKKDNQMPLPIMEKDFWYVDSRIHNFAEVVRQKSQELYQLVLSKKGCVYGYGASAKACVRLNYDKALADCIIGVFDDAPSKVGKCIPGTGIPILSPDRLREVAPNDIRPEYILILSRNVSNDLKKKAREHGFKGQFLEI